MAQRADWDNDDDFEILKSPSPNENFEYIENDCFEIVSCQKKSPLLINTNPIQPVPVIEKPVSHSIKIDTPVTPDIKQSLTNTVPLAINSNYLPIRYGSAARIPHDSEFDLKSILTQKPLLPEQSNDFLDILQQESKSKKHFFTDHTLQQLLIDNNHEQQRLVRIAKREQADFLNALHLD